MRISSLDPGFNTGVAIAILHESISTQHVTLEKYLLCTLIDEPAATAKLVLASRSKICLMEAKPKNAADSKWVPNARIRTLLKDQTVAEIGPGTWKPFMRSRLQELEPWAPETQHEKDAMAMLFYWCQITYPKRSIKYV